MRIQWHIWFLKSLTVFFYSQVVIIEVKIKNELTDLPKQTDQSDTPLYIDLVAEIKTLLNKGVHK